jgi:hypothetical protein
MTDDGLTRLSKLADDLFDAETQVTLIETQLRAAQKKVRDLSEFQIPELMDELEVSTFKTKSGVSVEVADKLHAGQLTQAHPDALEWLRKNGQGGLIKTLVSVPFTAGSEADADELVEQLSGDGIASTKSLSVHQSSNASAIASMLKEGIDVPIKLLRGYQKRVAKVTAKKR